MKKTMKTEDAKKHPNFISKKTEKWALAKCFECGYENYAANVLSGFCAWCGFDINSEDVEK